MECVVKNKDGRSFVWTALLMLVLFLLTASWMVFSQPLERAVVLTAIDDGLYYPRLAQNIASRGLCTYDGATLTNGFHPLWLLVLIPVYGAIHDPWLALRAVYTVILVIQLGALALLFLMARRIRMTPAGLAAAVLILFLNIRSFTIFFSFLESPLVLLALLGYLAFSLHADLRRFEHPQTAFVAGLLTGICFLARLDGFLLPLAYGFVLLFRLVKNRGAWRSLTISAASAAAGCLLLVVPYLAWNWVVFGHLQTVSAWQKTASFSPHASWRLISDWCLYQFIPRVQHILGLQGVPPGLLLSLMLLAGLLVLVYLLTGARRQRLVEKLRFCPDFLLFVAMHSVFIVLAAPQDAAASAWYWVPEILLAALVAGAGLTACCWGKIPVVTLAATCLAGVQLWAYPALVERKTMSWAKLEAARFLRENTPATARGAMFDSGIVSYFSQRDFTGLNGLIGDFRHATLMREKKYAEALERNEVGLLILDTPQPTLDELKGLAIYATGIKTKFENFNEPPKPFVVYRGSPVELEYVWQVRYKGCR